ncbi:MAG: hypothetical protein ACJ70Q_01460, partial [Nitrososphaera sp.]
MNAAEISYLSQDPKIATCITLYAVNIRKLHVIIISPITLSMVQWLTSLLEIIESEVDNGSSIRTGYVNIIKLHMCILCIQSNIAWAYY